MYAVDKLWENWGHFRKGKSAPSTPFPEKSSISPVDRTGKPIIVSTDEHAAVLKRGYRELIGAYFGRFGTLILAVHSVSANFVGVCKRRRR